MARREPHLVLGIALGASASTIKAAWRRLARQNHPDLTAGDPVASRAATRRMAEINAAYEELRDGDPKVGSRWAKAPRGTAARASGDRWSARAGATGPPRPRPARPVTAHLDTTDTFQPRNQTTTRQGGRGAHPLGQPPYRSWAIEREPPRASDPTGPLHRSRVRRFRPPEPPQLEQALGRRMAFGKLNGHTLGEIAAFEPSYIDWVASTITRDPDLVAAARVIRDDLDLRGVVRIRRAERVRRQPTD